MPSQRVAAELNTGTYYLTLTVQRWYYLFDRHNRWQIMSDSLHYCQDNKGLELNGYVFMLNPIHLIVTSPDIAGFLRDFKRFTSAKFKANLETTEPSVLKLFVDAQGGYRFWMETEACHTVPQESDRHLSLIASPDPRARLHCHFDDTSRTRDG